MIETRILTDDQWQEFSARLYFGVCLPSGKMRCSGPSKTIIREVLKGMALDAAQIESVLVSAPVAHWRCDCESINMLSGLADAFRLLHLYCGSGAHLHGAEEFLVYSLN